jgi:hypothetical protein
MGMSPAQVPASTGEASTEGRPTQACMPQAASAAHPMAAPRCSSAVMDWPTKLGVCMSTAAGGWPGRGTVAGMRGRRRLGVGRGGGEPREQPNQARAEVAQAAGQLLQGSPSVPRAITWMRTVSPWVKVRARPLQYTKPAKRYRRAGERVLKITRWRCHSGPQPALSRGMQARMTAGKHCCRARQDSSQRQGGHAHSTARSAAQRRALTEQRLPSNRQLGHPPQPYR